MNKRAAGSDRKLLVGQRMKLAAEQAGYSTTVAMGEALRVPNSTVSRWWNGKQSPSIDQLADYAELVGKRLWWFYIDAGDEEFDVLADALQRIVRLAMEGRDLADTYSQITGETDRFGRQERARLAAGTAPLRSLVRLGTDGDPEREPEVIDRVAAEVLRD